eukprot:scaffold102208_cov16-Tisochrysis_lutea.AAC.1
MEPSRPSYFDKYTKQEHNYSQSLEAQTEGETLPFGGASTLVGPIARCAASLHICSRQHNNNNSVPRKGSTISNPPMNVPCIQSIVPISRPTDSTGTH